MKVDIRYKEILEGMLERYKRGDTDHPSTYCPLCELADNIIFNITLNQPRCYSCPWAVEYKDKFDNPCENIWARQKGHDFMFDAISVSGLLTERIEMIERWLTTYFEDENE